MVKGTTPHNERNNMTNPAKADDIVGYIYQSEVLCRDCIYPTAVALFWKAGGRVESLHTETVLDNAALYSHIDRLDETSFDSDEFPKVVFRDSTQIERCDRCDTRLVYE
jgi:hypothetical protein